jgi:nucleotide-binding universal stress UspA family protein
MTLTTTPSSPPSQTSDPAFGSVLCGVERSRSDGETARQAAVLAGSAPVHLLCAWYDVGIGLAAQATMTEDSAKKALAKARHAAGLVSSDVHAQAVLREGVTEALLEEAPRHDLVVVGDHGAHRPAGITVGAAATNLAHRLTVPLLVTRPADRSFPQHVLVASDGSGSAHTAVRLAARVACQHGSRMTLVHVEGETDARRRRGFAEDAAKLFEELGVEPTIVYERGDAAEAIVRVAQGESADLVVVGARGLTGVKAFGSVSERVVHETPCSVLVARHP